MILVPHGATMTGRGIVLDEASDRLFPTTKCCGAFFVRDKTRRTNLVCQKCRFMYALITDPESHWTGKPLNSPSLHKAVATWIGVPAGWVVVKVER